MYPLVKLIHTMLKAITHKNSILTLTKTIVFQIKHHLLFLLKAQRYYIKSFFNATFIQTFCLFYSIFIFSKIETSSHMKNLFVKIKLQEQATLIFYDHVVNDHKHEECLSQCLYLKHAKTSFKVFMNCLLMLCKPLPFLPL